MLRKLYIILISFYIEIVWRCEPFPKHAQLWVNFLPIFYFWCLLLKTNRTDITMFLAYFKRMIRQNVKMQEIGLQAQAVVELAISSAVKSGLFRIKRKLDLLH